MQFDLRNVTTLAPSTDPGVGEGAVDVVIWDSSLSQIRGTTLTDASKRMIISFSPDIQRREAWLKHWASAVGASYLDAALLGYRDEALARQLDAEYGNVPAISPRRSRFSAKPPSAKVVLTPRSSSGSLIGLPTGSSPGEFDSPLKPPDPPPRGRMTPTPSEPTPDSSPAPPDTDSPPGPPPAPPPRATVPKKTQTQSFSKQFAATVSGKTVSFSKKNKPPPALAPAPPAAALRAAPFVGAVVAPPAGTPPVDTQTDDRRLSDEVVAAQVAAAAIDQGIKILDAEGGFKAQATLDVAVKAPSAEAGPLPDEMLIEQKTPQGAVSAAPTCDSIRGR